MAEGRTRWDGLGDGATGGVTESDWVITSGARW